MSASAPAACSSCRAALWPMPCALAFSAPASSACGSQRAGMTRQRNSDSAAESPRESALSMLCMASAPPRPPARNAAACPKRSPGASTAPAKAPHTRPSAPAHSPGDANVQPAPMQSPSSAVRAALPPAAAASTANPSSTTPGCSQPTASPCAPAAKAASHKASCPGATGGHRRKAQPSAPAPRAVLSAHSQSDGTAAVPSIHSISSSVPQPAAAPSHQLFPSPRASTAAPMAPVRRSPVNMGKNARLPKSAPKPAAGAKLAGMPMVSASPSGAAPPGSTAALNTPPAPRASACAA